MHTTLEIILPAHNEHGNVIPIYDEIKQALAITDYDYTILFVDDGSTDETLGQIKDLAKKILSIFSDQRIHRSMSRNARNNVLKKFSYYKVVKKYNDLYKKVINTV